MTNEHGEYHFTSLPPGETYLQIDRATIGYKRVTTQPEPVEITLHGGDIGSFDFGIVHSATVTGTVTRYEFENTSILDSASRTRPVKPQSDMYVQLSKGTELYRRITDNHGRFIFNDLRPGKWILSVPEGQLPENHYLEKETIEFEIKAGESRDILLNILPRRRAVKMLQEGNLIEEKPSPQQSQKTVQQSLKTPSTTPIIQFRKDKNGYVAQVSSWSNEEKANLEKNRIQQKSKYTPFVEKINLPKIGIRYRVFIGAFSTREEAETAFRSLQTK